MKIVMLTSSLSAAVAQEVLESAVGISMSQIASYWIAKHGKDNCQTAVAVAMAESGGNCGARNVNSDAYSSIDRGLWQINSHWHPECSDSCAYDCSCNAGCAVNVWKSSGWSAWNTYKTGAHKKYLNDAAVACGYTAEEHLQSESALGYSPSNAVAWADAHCADADGSQCAEFVSNALKAGGHANGCWYTWVPSLDSCLKNNAGWKQTSFPCSKGSVVIWYDSQGPYHTALSRGDGTIDQHNPNRCKTSGSWGSQYCLTPPSLLETSNATMELESSVGISMSQIASYWIAKHGKDNCQTAVAVAMAESGGNCGARNVNSDAYSSIDRGLWQINSHWHPECSDSCAYDCSCNAGCAVNVWKSSGWSAWNTYKTGAHKKYLNDAAVACGYTDVVV